MNSHHNEVGRKLQKLGERLRLGLKERYSNIQVVLEKGDQNPPTSKIRKYESESSSQARTARGGASKPKTKRGQQKSKTPKQDAKE